MQSGNKARSISALFRHLSTKWPAAFNPQAPRPLKFGIHNELRDRESELSDEELKRALRAYTKIDKYLAAMRVGAVRVDLDGKPCGVVTPAEAAGAEGLRRSRAATKQADRLPSPDTEGEDGVTGTSQ
jgi:ProP effector